MTNIKFKIIPRAKLHYEKKLMKDLAAKGVSNKQERDITNIIEGQSPLSTKLESIAGSITSEAQNERDIEDRNNRQSSYPKQLTSKKKWLTLTSVAVVLFIVLAGLFFSPELINSSSSQIDWDATLDNLDKASSILQNVFTVIALIVGGVWTYFTFVKGRALTPRLEPKLSLKTFRNGAHKYLVINVQLKNAGSSKVDIVQRGTLVGIYSYEPNSIEPPTEDIQWNRYKASPILKDHHWIEPGEIIEEPVLVPLPTSEYAIYKVLLRLNSKKTTWTTEAIIEGGDDPSTHAST